ncbi:uncharacterized protein LOC119596801 [Penaeus monodon]|uniref:uncharacterized protein LOC119596801 n=1 Tax=Penaeus monodon TaxID=6687 RepID=UPI0018A734D0|nr:uncharacterized protein LOC119596801 [Penaeus monodon]
MSLGSALATYKSRSRGPQVTFLGSTMNRTLVILLCLAGSLIYVEPYRDNYDISQESLEDYFDVNPYERFDYDWSVRYDLVSGDVNQEEPREEASAERINEPSRGSYVVQLPDRRIQTVTYYYDNKLGYIAEVSYEIEPEINKI